VNTILGERRACKPTDNARIEGFDDRLRAECLNACWFLSVVLRTTVERDTS
jgi:hypothetical protein